MHKGLEVDALLGNRLDHPPVGSDGEGRPRHVAQAKHPLVRRPDGRYPSDSVREEVNRRLGARPSGNSRTIS
eukprot:scaffold650442_cov52-Prasinocladus_malaysianus.AAC.1